VKPREELLEREALARELAGEEAVARVLSVSQSYNLPRGDRRFRSPVDDVLLPTAKVTAGTLRLALREAPLIVVILIAVFLTAESWQFFARLDGFQFAKVMGSFVVLIALVLLFAVREEWKAAYTIPTSAPEPSEIERPLADAGFGEPQAGLTAPWFSRWMLGLTQALRLLLESAVVGALAAGLFVVLGAIGVSPELAGSWSAFGGEETHKVDVLFEIPLLGDHAEPVTAELLFVSGAIGAIAALAFSVELATGERLREEGFLRDRFAGFGTAFRAWARLYEAEAPPRPEPPASEEGAAAAPAPG
jgi:hypothetical protein